jgi:hypothetical protein
MPYPIEAPFDLASPLLKACGDRMRHQPGLFDQVKQGSED